MKKVAVVCQSHDHCRARDEGHTTSESSPGNLRWPDGHSRRGPSARRLALRILRGPRKLAYVRVRPHFFEEPIIRFP
jgi:hypothetical protein